MRFESAGDRELTLGKSRFRGTLDVVKDASWKVSAVNTLDVESYLYGVLHNEVSSWWPMEALKAQAIAARSYALYQAAVNQSAEYDVKSGTSSQVYRGSATERFRTKAAVDQTAGEVLTYESKVFPAYFHAVCAGQTAAADELWKINLPPLAGRVGCGFCKISPHYYWHVRVPLTEIEEKVNQIGRPLGQILAIQIILVLVTFFPF